MTEARDTKQTRPVAPSKEKATMPSVWKPIDTLRSEIDRLFDDFHPFDFSWPVGRRTPGSSKAPIWGLSPATDMVERKDGYEITAELPGIDEKDIEIKLVNGVIAIHGEKQEEHEESEKDYHLSERRYGSFQRSFRLPDGTDAEKIEARFSKGVLTLRIPKLPSAIGPEKKIEIKAG